METGVGLFANLRKVDDEYDEDFDAVVSNSYGSEEGGDPDEIEMPPEPIPDGVYGMALASLIRDSAHFSDEGKSAYIKCIKCSRLCSSCIVVVIAISFQAFLLISTKTLITPTTVKGIRQLYSKYERTMYDGHVVQNKNNHSRGIDGFFNASNFKNLSDDDQNDACRIPLSEPMFLFVVLTIWTLTVFKHIRNNLNLALRLCFAVSNVSSPHAALSENDDGTHEIVGLACFQKVGVAVVQLIVICMNCVLLWIGARWLVATNGFTDLLLNAIALEFILDLPELIYACVVPKRTQMETQNTLVRHLFPREPAHCCSLFGMYLLGLLAIVLVLLYMYLLQQVLPGYKFDVSAVCDAYLEDEMTLGGGAGRGR
jgi:hypothetical protein